MIQICKAIKKQSNQTNIMIKFVQLAQLLHFDSPCIILHSWRCHRLQVLDCAVFCFGKQEDFLLWPPANLPRCSCPRLSLNLLPKGAGPLPGANLAATAGGLGLITLPHFDFLAAAPPLQKVCNWFWIVWGLQFILFLSVLVIAFMALMLLGSFKAATFSP